MPGGYLSSEDLIKNGFSKWKAEEIIREANKRIKAKGGMIGDRSSAPREEIEELLKCNLPIKEEGES